MEKCPRCGGYVIKERYWCSKGGCNYIRCIYCGHVWFEMDTKEEEETVAEEAAPPPDPQLVDNLALVWVTLVGKPKRIVSYEKIGKQLGISKQRVHMICKNAINKIRANSQGLNGWRVR